jgi:hypothetical protein
MRRFLERRMMRRLPQPQPKAISLSRNRHRAGYGSKRLLRAANSLWRRYRGAIVRADAGVGVAALGPKVWWRRAARP